MLRNGASHDASFGNGLGQALVTHRMDAPSRSRATRC